MSERLCEFQPIRHPTFGLGEWNFLPSFGSSRCASSSPSRPPHSVRRRPRRGHRKLTLKLPEPDALRRRRRLCLAGDGPTGSAHYLARIHGKMFMGSFFVIRPLQLISHEEQLRNNGSPYMPWTATWQHSIRLVPNSCVWHTRLLIRRPSVHPEIEMLRWP